MQIIKEGKVKGTTKVCQYCNATFKYYEADEERHYSFGIFRITVNCPCCGREIVVYKKQE